MIIIKEQPQTRYPRHLRRLCSNGRKNAQRSGFSNRLRPILYTELGIDFAIVPLDRIQGDEKPLADLAVRESLGHEFQHLQLAWA